MKTKLVSTIQNLKIIKDITRDLQTEHYCPDALYIMENDDYIDYLDYMDRYQMIQNILDDVLKTCQRELDIIDMYQRLDNIFPEFRQNKLEIE